MILIGAFGGLMGLIMGSTIGLVYDSAGVSVALGFVGMLIGAAFGFVIGWIVGYLCKITAQITLCKVELETNTRREPADAVHRPVARSAAKPAIERASLTQRSAADTGKGTARIPDARPARKPVSAAVAVMDPDETPVMPQRFNPAVDVKVRCRGCGKRFAGTAESIGALRACPRCKAEPFDVEGI